MSALKGYDKFLFDYLQLKPAQIKSFIKLIEGEPLEAKNNQIEISLDILIKTLILYLFAEGYKKSVIASYLTRIKFKNGNLVIYCFNKESAKKKVDRFYKSFADLVPMVGVDKKRLDLINRLELKDMYHYLAGKKLIDDYDSGRK